LTIGLIFTGGGMVKPTYITPRTLSIDAAGNLWNANYVATGGSISEFSNLGVPLSGTTGFTGNGLASPFSTAVDTSNPALILVANEGGVVLSEFTSAGAAATGSPFTPSTALSQPVDAEFDGSGNIWVANLAGFLTKMTSAGVFTSKSATTDLSSPYGIAVGAGTAGNIWVGNSGTNSTGKDATVYTNANVFSAFSATTYHTEGGIAIDSAGTAWVAQYEKYLTKITAPGATVVTYQPGASQYYLPELDSPMVDGGGNIWVSDFDDGCIYEVSNAGTILSGTFGFIAIGNSGYVVGKAPTTLVTEPNSLALDGSGNVWYTTTSDATIREIVGAAVPVATPTSYAVANSLLGTRP
jgi:sugar lactone lactonase YvrE